MFPQPEDMIHEFTEFNRQMIEGIKTLSRIHSEHIQIGLTPKEEVYRDDKMVLYHYFPFVKRPCRVPVLIAYALVNRPYMVDLQENRSLVRSLIHQGIDVYLIDWGYPTRADRWLTLDDYINDYIDVCVDTICERHSLDQISLLGICQGGVFSLCYAALHPEKVKNLVAMVTPVDFHAGQSVISRWAGHGGTESGVDVDQVVDALGMISGDVLNIGFLLREPFGLNIGKYLGLIDLFDNEYKLLNFLRVEKWSFDSPDLSGEAFREFLKDCYQHNKLIKGEMQIGGQRVDLGRVTMPVLNLHALYVT
jgi:polyhydroxyalkanoate synthase